MPPVLPRFAALGAVALAWLIILALLAFACAGSAHADPAAITVEVSGLRTDRGHVLVALYDAPDVWTVQGRELATCGARVVRGRARCALHEVPSGTYAIAILHDEDDDGTLDRDFIGWPQEGFGFSNDVGPSLGGPPSFASAAFDHESETTVRIRARYGL